MTRLVAIARAALLCFVVFGVLLVDGHRVCNVLDHGAVGDNRTLDTDAFSRALSACSGGGEILVPQPGVYRLGALNVTVDDVILRIEPGAVLSFAPDVRLYPRMPHLPSYPCDRDICSSERYNPCLLVYRARNVTITGGGMLDGNGWWWWRARRSGALSAGRPRLLSTMWASRVEISHVRLHNSPFWTTHIWASRDVEVAHVEVWAPRDSPNTDGVDPDSSTNVWVHHLHVRNGDDGIAIKSGMNAAGRAFATPTTNVVVEHSWFPQSNGLSIGSEISGGVHNVTFRHNSVGPFGNGAYIKTAPARGGYVTHVTYHDIMTHGPNEMIRVNTNYGGDDAPAPSMTIIKDIRFVRMQGNASKPGKILCTTAIPCNQFTFDSVVVSTPSDHEQYKCNGTITGTQSNCSPEVACVPSS